MTQAQTAGTANPHMKPHNLPLDSVRGIAALCVVVHHFVISSTFGQFLDLHGPVADFFWNCWIFVDLFFVLSGIVMAMNYGRPAGRFPAKDFLVRRLARIYPLHLAMLLLLLPLRGARIASAALGLPVVSALGHEVNTPYAFVMHLFLLNALGTVGDLSWNGPSWSISAEFYTYMVFAAVVALLAANRLLALTGQIFALVSVTALLAVLFVLREDSLEFHYDFGILRCLYSFSLGVVTFRLVETFRGRLGWLGGGLAQAFLALAAIALVARVGEYGRLSFAAPPVFALVLASLLLNGRTALGRGLSVAPLVWLGQRSYAIYMIHSTIIVLVEYACRGAGIARVKALNEILHGGIGLILMLGIVALVLLLSDFTLKFIEKPGSRLVLGLFDRPRPTRPVPALDLQDHR